MKNHQETVKLNPEKIPNQKVFYQKIFSEKIDLLYKNLLLSVPSSLLCAMIVFIALYRIPHSSLLIYWILAIIVWSVIRFGLFALYLQNRQATKSGFYFFLSSTIIAAALWGFAGSLLMPNNHLIEQMIVIVILAGITAGVIQSLQASLLAGLIYMGLVLVPLCIWVFLQNNTAYTILGFSITTYLLFTVAISLKGFYFLNHTLQLKYENLALAENVSQTNIELKKLNRDLIEKENNLRLIHDNAPIGMAIVSLEGRWLNVNNRLCQILGYRKEELEQLTIQDITYPEDLENDFDRKAKLLSGQLPSYQAEKRYVNKDDQLIWILTNVSLVRNKEDKPLYFISQIQDINDRKRNEKIINGLNRMNEMLQLCHDSSEAYPIITHTAQDLFSELSGGFTILNEKIDAQKRVGTWGRNPLLKPFFKSLDCWAFRAGNTYIMNDPSKDSICHHFESSPQGGSICLPLIVQSEIVGLLNFTAPGAHSITHYQQQIINNFSEIIKLSLANIHLNEVLREQAIHDPLTGLLNRRYLYEWLPRMLHHVINAKSVLCVCVIDLDFFKHINDVYGHEAGDEVLKFVGKLLKNNLRESDIVCRYGGEEFVAVLVGSDLKHATHQIEQIRNEIKNASITVQNQLLSPITISAGLAEAPQHGVTTNEILRSADSALYAAKKNGRNKVLIAQAKV